jgi:SAM-dependent methyltransferase
MRSTYVCPRTREPLNEGEDGLTGGGGVGYRFIRGWGDAPIPDFLNPYELGDAGRKSLDMYNQPASVGVYRNFLDWLFQTFGESEPDFRRRLVRKLNLKEGGRVLVTGCGLGDDVPAALAAVADGGEVYAQDLSSEMAVAASAYVLPERPGAKVFFSVSNATRLPFADAFFDGAFHFGGINLFDDVGAAVREMARVVRPGGRVVFGDEGVAPWLRETDYGRAAITNNSLWGVSAPVELLPESAVDVSLSWVLGNCFYVIDFEVSDTGPYMNMDVPHKGRRGGTMRTRYFGQLEGVTEESKRFVLEDAERRGVSVHDWLEQAIRERRGR